MNKRSGTDISAQTAFIGKSKDDIKFKQEKRRKYAPKVTLDPIPDGPCCLRCKHWLKPIGDEQFGDCLKLATITGNSAGSPERGYTAGIEAALEQPTWIWRYMRTRPGFVACSRFVALAAVSESEAAA